MIPRIPSPTTMATTLPPGVERKPGFFSGDSSTAGVAFSSSDTIVTSLSWH
jgi:hypothetical protein